MRVIAGLRDEHFAVCAFDEVMRAHVGHDLRPREDLGV
jgi:hypothetical protein